MSKKVSSVIVGILGIWLAAGLAAFYIGTQLATLPYIDCSGMNPCTDEEYSIYFTGFTLGGVAGALLISTVIQYINKKKVQFRVSFAYGVIGALLWPLVGITVFLISIIPLAILGDIPLVEQYATAIVLTLAFGLCGAVIGLVVFQTTKERPAAK